jgi:hypothetical protein
VALPCCAATHISLCLHRDNARTPHKPTWLKRYQTVSSLQRWCCGDMQHFDVSTFAFEKVCTVSLPSRAPSSFACTLVHQTQSHSFITNPMQLADVKWGVVGIRYRRVPCDYKPQKAAYRPSYQPAAWDSWPVPWNWNPSQDKR